MIVHSLAVKQEPLSFCHFVNDCLCLPNENDCNMLFCLTDSIIALFNQALWFLCESVFWCFRFIEIIPNFFSIIFGSVKFILSLNHAVFSSVLSFVDYTRENCIQIFVGAKDLPGLIMDNVQELSLFIVLSSKKGFCAITSAGAQSLLFCQQEIVNSAIFFKDFGYQIVSSFMQVFWRMITSISIIILELISCIGLFLESHVNTVGKYLIHILIMKPLELLAYTGDIIFTITADTTSSTLNIFQWISKNFITLMSILYAVLASFFSFLDNTVRRPFSFLNEHIGNKYLLFIFGIFCIIGYLIAYQNANNILWTLISNFRFGHLNAAVERRNNYNENKDDSQHLNGFECVVCLDRKKTVLLLPCKHLCLCPPCHNEIKGMTPLNRTCPLCRVRIKNHLVVYF